MAQYIISLGQEIKQKDTCILSIKFRYFDQIIREATDIALHPNNMIREDASTSASHGSLSSTS
jgi:hypothetical protein